MTGQQLHVINQVASGGRRPQAKALALDGGSPLNHSRICFPGGLFLLLFERLEIRATAPLASAF